MKHRFCLLVIASLFALLIMEIVCRYLLQYPIHVGHQKYLVKIELKEYAYTKCRNPYYSFWSAEEGIKKIKFNNIGLPGIDVDVSSKSKYIFLCGDSYVEAIQIEQEKISSSIFQKKLSERFHYHQVINLGKSAYDPYLAFFRCILFEKWYPPDYIFLVIEDLNRICTYLERHTQPLDFNIPSYIGRHVPETKTQLLVDTFRDRSSLLTLLSHGVKLEHENTDFSLKADTQIEPTRINTAIASDCAVTLSNILGKFNERYSDRLIVISISSNMKENDILAKLCKEKRIKLAIRPLNLPNNQIKGMGHLNYRGNLLLGELLYEAFISNFEGK